MNTTEAVLLLRKVHAYRPAQHIDELTGDAWAEALDDIRYVDADEALVAIVKRTSDWITPDAIRAEVRRIRNRRIDQHPPVEPPPDLDPQQQLAWTRAIVRRIGDGEQIPDQYRGALHARDIRQLTGGTAA
jgi:hypothetical protein